MPAFPKLILRTSYLKVTDFENRYTYWNSCNKAFAELNNHNSTLIQYLRSGQQIKLKLTETEIVKFQKFMQFLIRNNILDFQRIPESEMNVNGTYYSCFLVPLPRLAETLLDPNFRV